MIDCGCLQCDSACVDDIGVASIRYSTLEVIAIAATVPQGRNWDDGEELDLAEGRLEKVHAMEDRAKSKRV